MEFTIDAANSTNEAKHTLKVDHHRTKLYQNRCRVINVTQRKENFSSQLFIFVFCSLVTRRRRQV